MLERNEDGLFTSLAVLFMISVCEKKKKSNRNIITVPVINFEQYSFHHILRKIRYESSIPIQ